MVIKDKIREEKQVAMDVFKKRMIQMDKDKDKTLRELDQTTNMYNNIDKQYKIMANERLKMVDRIKKLKARRGKFEEGSRVCKKCGKDFMESENFNWSCTTHQSEFSGEMWWCCGKLTKEARGCKF